MVQPIAKPDLLSELGNLGDRIGRTPRVQDMRDNGNYSPTAYYNHFKSWNAALRKAGFEPTIASKTAPCGNCGQSISRPRHRIENQKNVFCDTECETAWRRDYYCGENNPKHSERIVIECEYCGDESERLPFRVKGRDNLFCDRDCHLQWIIECYNGEDHHSWKGGGVQYTMYGPNWFQIRKNIIQSQNGCCRVCSVHRDNLDRDLDVHHVKPLREFNNPDGSIDWDRANHEDNLVALCRSCHNDWEGLPVLPNELQM